EHAGGEGARGLLSPISAPPAPFPLQRHLFHLKLNLSPTVSISPYPLTPTSPQWVPLPHQQQ
ncbi:hypothetical protein B0T14DRAFT_443429, partial [Immersiella caudata]